MSWLPYCSIDRTFTSISNFPHKATKTNQIKHVYRNPIYLARDYKRMIDNGHVKNQSSLARKLGISRVRIHQILSLLLLWGQVLQYHFSYSPSIFLIKMGTLSLFIISHSVTKSSKIDK